MPRERRHFSSRPSELRGHARQPEVTRIPPKSNLIKRPLCEGKFKECKECRMYKYLSEEAMDGGPLYCVNPEVLKRWEIKELAQKLVKKYMETSPPVQPKSVLPAATYIACVAKGMRKTQYEISLIYGVSTPTIRKVYKDIVKKVGAIGDRDYDELIEAIPEE